MSIPSVSATSASQPIDEAGAAGDAQAPSAAAPEAAGGGTAALADVRTDADRVQAQLERAGAGPTGSREAARIGRQLAKLEKRVADFEAKASALESKDPDRAARLRADARQLREEAVALGGGSAPEGAAAGAAQAAGALRVTAFAAQGPASGPLAGGGLDGTRSAEGGAGTIPISLGTAPDKTAYTLTKDELTAREKEPAFPEGVSPADVVAGLTQFSSSDVSVSSTKNKDGSTTTTAEAGSDRCGPTAVLGAAIMSGGKDGALAFAKAVAKKRKEDELGVGPATDIERKIAAGTATNADLAKLATLAHKAYAAHPEKGTSKQEMSALMKDVQASGGVSDDGKAAVDLSGMTVGRIDVSKAQKGNDHWVVKGKDASGRPFVYDPLPRGTDGPNQLVVDEKAVKRYEVSAEAKG